MYNCARLVSVKCVVGEVELSFCFTNEKHRGITVFRRRHTRIDTITPKSNHQTVSQNMYQLQEI